MLIVLGFKGSKVRESRVAHKLANSRWVAKLRPTQLNSIICKQDERSEVEVESKAEAEARWKSYRLSVSPMLGNFWVWLDFCAAQVANRTVGRFVWLGFL